ARAAAGTVRVSGPPVPPQNVGPDVPKVPAYLRSPQPTDARQRGAQQRAAAGTVRVSGPPVPPQNVGPDVPKVPAYLRSPQPTDARGSTF
ncbi:hypothetical protein EAO68_38775, partial [Streptomyces sp. wa22]